ncbi:MAG: hypothetical protein LBQ21_04035 [Clostridiales Family XIII bacterium]|nr:hypothetical protein [Clostridiales Family XIII bacterium]
MNLEELAQKRVRGEISYEDYNKMKEEFDRKSEDEQNAKEVGTNVVTIKNIMITILAFITVSVVVNIIICAKVAAFISELQGY